METTNEKRHRLLGMSQGKAANKLRKLVLFSLLKETNKDICYRCKVKIETVEELSIEHKKSWLNSEDPIRLFWDLNNISFSHLKCNISHSSSQPKEHTKKVINSPIGCSWCSKCKNYKKISEFHSNKSKRTMKLRKGLSWWCKDCYSYYKKNQFKK